MSVDWAAIGIAVAIISALVGIIYKVLDRDVARVSRRLDEHVAEDVLVHERVAIVETKLEICGDDKE